MYQKNHLVLIGGYFGSSMIMAQNFQFIVFFWFQYDNGSSMMDMILHPKEATYQGKFMC